MKIISSGKALNSPGFYKKKKQRQRIQIGLIVLGVLILISGLVYLTRQDRFLIKEVEVLEKDSIDADEIVETAKSLLSGNYLWLVPRSSSFVYPRGNIEEALLSIFPRLNSIELNLIDMQKLSISVSEREPFALYCSDALQPTNTSECYFLDRDGLIFSQAPSFSGITYFVFATDEAIPDPIGKHLLNQEEFKSVLNFVENLTLLNINSLALGISSDQYDIFLPTGGQINIKRFTDFASVYSNLTAFLADETIKSQADFLDRVLYLDLRIEDKIRWKFKDQ